MAYLYFPCFLFFLSSFPHKALSFQKCPATYYVGNGSQPPVIVQFPFVAGTGDQFHRCGYPGFNLTSDGQTAFISLPFSSGKFTVLQINYSAQIISVSDPNSCLPKRILTLNLTNSPFSGAGSQNYTFLNCSEGARVRDAVAVACLSGENFTVCTTSGEELASETGQCRPIKSILAPAMSSRSEIVNRVNPGTAFMQLTWNVPDCRRCTYSDDGMYYCDGAGVCGFKHKSGLEVECSGDAKYRLMGMFSIGMMMVFACLAMVLVSAYLVSRFDYIKCCCAGNAIPENNNVSNSQT